MPFRLLLSAAMLCLFSSFILSQGYTDVSISSGVGFVHQGQVDSYDMGVGTGAAWFDYDNDGWQDLYITNRVGANKLFRNLGNGTFSDVALSLGVEDIANDGSGVVAGDINNDGHIDLYLANSDNNILYKNNGDNSFTDITITAGLDIMGPNRSTSATFGDYNNDGFLDLYIAHHMGIMSTGIGSTKDYFFINNGDETFADVSQTLLDTTYLVNPGFIGGWSDIDGDNDQDLIVINDCPLGPGTLYGTLIFENEGGTHPVNDWTLPESSPTLIGDDCAHGMGLAIGDPDRDGDFDILYSNVGYLKYFINENGVFTENDTAGFDIQTDGYFSWGCSFLDYDNDGWQDVSVAIGALHLVGEYPDQESQFFKNNTDGTFTDIAPTLGLDDDARTRTIVHADYDKDGDLDLLMINYDDEVRLFRNDDVNSNNYLRIALESSLSAPNGIGSKIEINTNDGVTQYFEMRAGSDLGGCNELFAHFGLGTATGVNNIKVKWLSGAVSTMNNPSINSVVTVIEPVSPYIHVRKSAIGNSNGSNWADAYNELTDALAAAVSGDTILVTEGTYYPTTNDNEELSFLINADITILGGFPHCGGLLSHRDPLQLKTILSGDIGSQNSNSNQSHNLIKVASTVTDANLVGFEMKFANADGASSSKQQGAGILSEGKILLQDVDFRSNTSLLPGSDICCIGANGEVTLDHCYIQEENSVPAVSILQGAMIIIKENCIIDKGI
ncbi:MAG: hypothetical protein ACJA1A_000297 [Saprospiraceae bacterium]|jgi:hypothetical protein